MNLYALFECVKNQSQREIQMRISILIFVHGLEYNSKCSWTNTRRSLSSTSLIYGSNPLCEIFYNIIIVFLTFSLACSFHPFIFICFSSFTESAVESVFHSNRVYRIILYTHCSYTFAKRIGRNVLCAAHTHRQILFETGYIIPFSIQLIRNFVMD